MWPHPTPPQEGGVLNALATSAASADARIITRSLPSLEIVHVNQAWVNLCGFTSNDALGKTCRILQGPSSSPDALCELHKAIRDLRPTVVRLINYTKARVPFHCELTIEPLFDSDETQSVVHFLGILKPCHPESSPKHSLSAKPANDWCTNNTKDAYLASSANSSKESENSAVKQKISAGPSKESQSMSSSAHTAMGSLGLLGREAFPLQTLKNHPVAPVLLRMLQLNKEVTPKQSGDPASPSVPAEMRAAKRNDWRDMQEDNAREQEGQMEIDLSNWQQAMGEHRFPNQMQLNNPRQKSASSKQALPSSAGSGSNQPSGNNQSMGRHTMRWNPDGCGSSSSDAPQQHNNVRNEAWLAAVARQGVLALESVAPLTSPEHSSRRQQDAQRPTAACEPRPATSHTAATERQLAAESWLAAHGFGNLTHLDSMQAARPIGARASSQRVHAPGHQQLQGQKRSYVEFQCDEYQGRLSSIDAASREGRPVLPPIYEGGALNPMEAQQALHEALQGGAMLHGQDDMMDTSRTQSGRDNASIINDLLNDSLEMESHGMSNCNPSIESELESLDAVQVDDFELDGVLSVLEKWEKLEKPDCECQ